MTVENFIISVELLLKEANDLNKTDVRFANVKSDLCNAVARIDPTTSMELRTKYQMVGTRKRFNTTPPQPAYTTRKVSKNVLFVEPAQTEDDEVINDQLTNEQNNFVEPTEEQISEAEKLIEAKGNVGQISTSLDDTLLVTLSEGSPGDISKSRSLEQLKDLAYSLGLPLESEDGKKYGKMQLSAQIRKEAKERL